MSYKLERSIDILLQEELGRHCLNFTVEFGGSIKVFESKIDSDAEAALIYLTEPALIPEGALPFLIVNVKGIFGVFTVDNTAAIIEASSTILEPK